MQKTWLLGLFAAVGAVAFLALARQGQAASINETDLPQEADFCVLQFPPVAGASPGQTVQVIGQIFESGVTEATGQGPFILADVGIGPVGSDPRTEVNWTFTPAVYLGDAGNNDEYAGDITAPSAVDPMEYAYVVRFSTDGTQDFTYCDLDGAGSDLGLVFDVDQLGLLTVTGTGGGGGGGEGSVNTSVDVIADPGACIILDTNAVSFGQETFSTQNAAQLGLAQMNVTSCSLTTSLDLLAKGTNASGPTANWSLTDPPGTGNMCDTGNNGVDEFSQRVQTNTGNQGTNLALTNRTYMTGLAQGASQPTDLLLRMPCIGSSGTGETVSSTITFTAIPGAGDADGDGYSPPFDCDDGDPSVNPGAFDIGDGIDNDCDGLVDEEGADADGDGYSSPDDCDDNDASVNPGAPEIGGDGMDNNCNGLVDEEVVDADGDGYSPPGDCNDSDPSINPGATEVQGNGIDDDCDTVVDEAPPNVCAVNIEFLDIGTSQFDNTSCLTGSGEPVASCEGIPGADHSQYLVFELQFGETATVTVTADWDAVVALYDETAVELLCSDTAAAGGSESFQMGNTSGASQFFIVQVDGYGSTDFGAYQVTLSIGN